MALQLRVYVPPHPLIKHWLAMSRSVSTPSVLFRTAMKELGRWLTYEAVREWLPTEEVMVQTPLSPSPATTIATDVPIVAVPILRAGLTLLDGALEVLPNVNIYHLGMKRDEETLQPHCYLNKLPEKFNPQTRVLLTDPMLATGGTLVAAVRELTQRGIDPSLIRIVAVVTSHPALQQISEAYPNLTIFTAGIDEQLDDRSFIVPGLGDAGDRAFGTA